MLSCLESTQFHLILDCNLQIEKNRNSALASQKRSFPSRLYYPHLHFKVKQHQPSCKLSIEMKSSSIQIRTFQYPSSISVRVSRTKNIQICPRGPFVSTNCHWGNTYQVDVTDLLADTFPHTSICAQNCCLKKSVLSKQIALIVCV